MKTIISVISVVVGSLVISAGILAAGHKIDQSIRCAVAYQSIDGPLLTKWVKGLEEAGTVDPPESVLAALREKPETVVQFNEIFGQGTGEFFIANPGESTVELKQDIHTQMVSRMMSVLEKKTGCDGKLRLW